MDKPQQSTSTLAFTMAILTASMWALHAAPVNAAINAGKTFAPINPNLYGMFIEHAGGLVYRGMWAEMIDDRKFYDPITAQGPDSAEQPRARRGGGFGGRDLAGPPPRTSFTFTVLPHSYMAFAVKKVYVSSNTMN